MKILTTAVLALSILGGPASAITHPTNFDPYIDTARFNDAVSVQLKGATATLVGQVATALEADHNVRAALAIEGVNKVVNLITVKSL